MHWYDEYPERLELELSALQEAGFAYAVDEESRATGQFVLTVTYCIGENKHPLKVVFPPDYPYFPFQVFAPTLNLSDHQDPFSKILCVVAHIDSEWNGATDTVAKYLLKQLPEVLRANEGGTAVAEAREGAPITGFMNFAPGSLVITADWRLTADKQRGTLLIGIEKGSNPNALLRGAVLEVHDLDGNLLGEADLSIKNRYPIRFHGRWVRLVGPPKSTAPLQVLSEATSVWAELKMPSFDGGPDVVGIVFQDKARFKEMHDLWVFVVRHRVRIGAPHSGKRLPPGDQITHYLARPDRGSRDDIQTRVPRL
ncbi:MAG: E2/UBC family protein, partial [Anaerolineales bacterium]|nr:E2/UBC family protein [Anaerolineales bacterium]